jgi:hypothetical protein
MDSGDDGAVGAGGLAACGGRVDRAADRAVPAPGARAPAVCTIPPGRPARPAPWRGRRTALDGPGPGRRDVDGDRATAATGRAAGDHSAKERGGAAGGRAGPDYNRGAARLPGPPAGRACRRGRRMDRDRIRIHHLHRDANWPRPADPAVAPSSRRVRAAPGHPAWTTARRSHHRPVCWPARI